MYPEKIIEDNNSEAWYRFDYTFQMPKVSFYTHFKSIYFNETVEKYVHEINR